MSSNHKIVEIKIFVVIIKTIFCEIYSSIINGNVYSLESAGDGGLFIVSGLMQSDGDGDLSRFVTVPKPKDSPCPRLSFRFVAPLPMLVE